MAITAEFISTIKTEYGEQEHFAIFNGGAVLGYAFINADNSVFKFTPSNRFQAMIMDAVIRERGE